MFPIIIFISALLLIQKLNFAKQFKVTEEAEENNANYEKQREKDNCMNFEYSSKFYRSLSFQSRKDGQWKTIFANKNDELGNGGFGKVYAAFVKSVDGAHGIPINRCLAVKEIQLGSGSANISSKGFRNSIKVLKKIENLDENKRRHLLKIYDYGMIGNKEMRTKRAVIIMEKGTVGFDQRLYSSDNNVQKIVPMIRQIVQPIKEMHQGYLYIVTQKTAKIVAMHLDVKPHNYLYVPSSSAAATVNDNLDELNAADQAEETELLKLIDFDGAEPIPEKRSWILWRRRLGRHRLADRRKKPKNQLTSPMYSSPENYRIVRGCSTKADIWSVGIIIYEIILVRMERNAQRRLSEAKMPPASSSYSAEAERKDEIFRLAITVKLFHIQSIYAGKVLNLKAKVPIPKAFVYDLHWIQSSADEIKNILKIWLKYRRLAVLVTNLLQIVPEKRMTAEGILDYLDGKCYPADVGWDYAWTGIMFNKVSCKKLSELIVARIEICDSEQCTKKWKEMGKMMDKVTKVRQEIVKKKEEMPDNVKHCATKFSEEVQKDH